MQFNLQDFIGTVGPIGFQKPSKFLVTIFVPPNMSADSTYSTMTNNAQELMFWASSAAVPGLDFGTSSIKHWGYGAPEKRPIAPAFGECQVVFNCDAEGIQWTFFKNWMDFIVNFDSYVGMSNTTPSPVSGPGGALYPYEVSYKEDYMTSIYIQTFADNGANNIIVGLNEVYPISLGNIRLDWGSTDQVARFSTAFTFRDWYIY